MAMRPRRPGIARTLSERARAGARAGGEGGEAPAGPGASGIGGLFDSLREMAERVAALASETQAAADRHDGAGDAQEGSGTQDFEIGGKAGRVVFGYSIRTGLDGAGAAEPFGHVPERGPAPPDHASGQSSGRRPAADAPRLPIVDVFEEPDCIVVVAEIPGAAEGAVSCRVEGDALLIEARGARRYRKHVALPGAVDAAGLTQALRNGILEVRLPRGPVA